METYSSVWTDLLRQQLEVSWVDAGGIRTRMMHAGRKGQPPVIMLPGTSGHLETFSRNLAAHAAEFDCYAIDKLGHGFTDKPDHDYEIRHYVEHLRAFMDAVGLEKASFIGVSLGAWVATRFAITYPQRADKLSLISAPGIFANAPNMNTIKSSRSNAVEDPSWDNVKAVLEWLMYDPTSVPPDLVAVRQAIYRQPEMARAMPHILALQKQDIRKRNLIAEDEWRSITSPTLFIAAVDHQDEYLETAQIAAKWVPGARLVDMRKVGHWPHFEDAETFNTINLPFLRGEA